MWVHSKLHMAMCGDIDCGDSMLHMAMYEDIDCGDSMLHMAMCGDIDHGDSMLHMAMCENWNFVGWRIKRPVIRIALFKLIFFARQLQSPQLVYKYHERMER